MRKTLLLSVLIVLICIVAIRAHSENVTIDGKSTIDSVTVYIDAALVKRLVKVDIPAGRSAVRIDGLPDGLTSENTMISGKGDCTLISSEFYKQLEVIPEDPKVAELLKKQDELNDKRDALNDELDVLAEKELYYKSMLPKDPDIDENLDKIQDLKVEDVEKLLDFIGTGLVEFEKEYQQKQLEIETIDEEIDLLDRQIEKLGGREIQHNQCRVTLKADNATTIELEIASLLSRCNWTTTYDVRLQEDNSVSLSYYAIVHQRTYEDWNSVNMRLSTSSIRSVKLPPGLQTLAMNLTKLDEKKSKARDPYMPAPATTGPGRYVPPSADKRPRSQDRAKAESFGNGIAVEFPLLSKVNIPGDGTKRQILIVKKNLTGAFEYETTPRVEDAAFARLEVENNTGFPFIAGTLRTFSGGEFLGTTPMHEIAVGEKFILFLGKDPRIETKIKDLIKRLDEGRKTNETEYSWVLEIKNNRNQAVMVNIRDILPKLHNDEIKLKKLKFSVDPDNEKTWEEDENRMVNWKVTIPPGGKQEIKIQFVITSPADKILSSTGTSEGGR